MPQILYCEQQAVRLVCMPCRVQCKLQSGDCATKELFNFQRQRLKVLDSVPATPLKALGQHVSPHGTVMYNPEQIPVSTPCK